MKRFTLKAVRSLWTAGLERCQQMSAVIHTPTPGPPVCRLLLGGATALIQQLYLEHAHISTGETLNSTK